MGIKISFVNSKNEIFFHCIEIYNVFKAFELLGKAFFNSDQNTDLEGKDNQFFTKDGKCQAQVSR